jgi:hypothetical protein
LVILVERGAPGWLRVNIGEADDLDTIQIRIGPDVSAGDSSRALFESGAALQQTGGEFLVSTDWLRRHAADATSDLIQWEARFGELLTTATEVGTYAEAFDAIRVPVVYPTAGDARPSGIEG